ncbi:MAG: hypothetical protein M1831_006628 [Alyxoria varia]|nr:MAG: hypothetical protein M1831_006628 [Alyxoria varia]
MVRIKQRYLLLQLLYPSAITSNAEDDASTQLAKLHAPSPGVDSRALLRLIRNSLRNMYGEHGAAVAGGSLSLRYWSSATSVGILRCRREVARMVWGAVTWMRVVEVGGGGEGKSSGGGRGGREGRGRGRGRGRGEMVSAPSYGGNERFAQSERKNVEVVVRVLRCSGTIKKCEEEAIRRSREVMGRVKGLKEAEVAGAEMRHLGLGVAGSALSEELVEGDEGRTEVQGNLGMGLGAIDDEDEEEEDEEDE